MKDLFLLDKPKGITSFECIKNFQKKIGVKKIGHAGTLDPRASGLLLVGVGDGTKKLHDLFGLPKVYQSEILLGIKTNTGDFDPNYPNGEGDDENGKIIERKKVSQLSEEKIKKVLESMVGDTVLEVSLFSAMKRRGKSLYRYAQKGEVVTKPKRVMTVYKAVLKEVNFDSPLGIVIKVEFEVGSGTYIRSLVEEIGERLGTVATLINLRRTSIGDFSVEDVLNIE